MWGIEGKDLEPIHSVAKQFDSNYNSEKLGAWGILFLCCGAMAGRNGLWYERAKNSDTFVRPSDLDELLQGSDVCISDDYAVKFSEFIKKWSNDSVAIAVIEKRLENSRGKMSDKAFLCRKTYLTLAFMLNSLQDLPREELLGFDCQTWVSMSDGKERNYGWPELFFAAGLLLNNEDSVCWDKMVSVIRGMGRSSKVDVTELFEYFLKSGSTRIRTEQLKKGARVRMRNGWEAIIVKECDGNTLIAKVFGAVTETGCVYAHDIVATEVDGKWLEVEMTEEQAQFYGEVKPFLCMSEPPRHPRKSSMQEEKKSALEEMHSSLLKAEREYDVPKLPPKTIKPFESSNKIFTEVKAAKARDLLQKKLGGNLMDVLFDPELIQAGIDLAGYYIEGGSRSFVDCSKKMIADLGDTVRPYLKCFYMAAKYQPGLNKAGMDTEAIVDGIDENAIDVTDNMSKNQREVLKMNVPEMAALARDHWKVTNPQVYRRMVRDKALVAESEGAAKLTLMEMKALMLLKMTEEEAWQESRHLFIFRTADQLEQDYRPDRDEEGKVLPPSWRTD